MNVEYKMKNIAHATLLRLGVVTTMSSEFITRVEIDLIIQ